MPINAGYEYVNAEKKYYQAQTLDEKIVALQELIKTAPKHKGSENLLAELKTRLKKFLEKQEKVKSTGKTTRKTIKKEGFQVVLVGLTNVGKSSLLARITNASPKINSYAFTTKEPELGTLDYQGIKAQIVDLPPIGSENFDSGIVNTADMILIVLESLEELEKISLVLAKATGKRLIVINKVDLLSRDTIRKLEEKIKSKKLNALPVSCVSNENIEKLKERIIKQMEVIRVYMKEPNKIHSPLPMVAPLNSTVKDIAEKIRNGFSQKIKETRVTGPSSKFPNQRVGLSHVLKDQDIIEFHTK
ncbi:MAG: GTPase [Nanoarchaeota archaeon]|nr:GTPase [Nanoarchaeota archaeon]